LNIYSAIEAFEVQFIYGGSGAPSRIHQVEAFSVLIRLVLLIARCWFSILGFQNLKPHHWSIVLCLGSRLQWCASGWLCNFLLSLLLLFLWSKFNNYHRVAIVFFLLFKIFFPLPVLSSCFYLILLGKKLKNIINNW